MFVFTYPPPPPTKPEDKKIRKEIYMKDLSPA